MGQRFQSRPPLLSAAVAAAATMGPNYVAMVVITVAANVASVTSVAASTTAHCNALID